MEEEEAGHFFSSQHRWLFHNLVVIYGGKIGCDYL
jgi:hypothetical protein